MSNIKIQGVYDDIADAIAANPTDDRTLYSILEGLNRQSGSPVDLGGSLAALNGLFLRHFIKEEAHETTIEALNAGTRRLLGKPPTLN